MKKDILTAILCLTVFSLVLAGCTPANRITNPATPGSQDQIIALANTPTPAAQVEGNAQPAAPLYAAFDGLVWEDLNRDGIQDFNEPGMPIVDVSLLSNSKAVAGSTVTDASGAYRFQDLAPGDYYLFITAPTGYVFSSKDLGQNELVDSDNDPILAETNMVTLAAGENGVVWTTGLYSPAAALQAEPGTVKPPPPSIDVCAAGTYSLGGISTLQISRLALDYCLHAFLWNHAFAIGRIPNGAGTVLSGVTFLEVYYQGTFVYKYDVPGETDSIQVCYAVPLGNQAQIYFLDFYGPRFGQRTGQPVWVPLPTTLQDGIACAVAQTSGAYALIGK